MAFTQADAVLADHDVTDLIDAAATGPAEHLQDLVGAQGLLDVVAAVAIGGQGDTAQAEVDAGGQTHGRGHDPELAGFGEWFDNPGPSRIA